MPVDLWTMTWKTRRGAVSGMGWLCVEMWKEVDKCARQDGHQDARQRRRCRRESTAERVLGSESRRSEVRRHACSTVVWSRPPK